ncbi:MAG: hypothetical protein KME42_12580 [Tildeniella nuda ZEHNDER 1965/U140]|jgi:hypothetical protein|nr:hypothetical protein [Tildeniella nuda ZEHNDER 1965/U140]
MSETIQNLNRYIEPIHGKDGSLYECCAAVAQNFAPKESDRKGEGSAKVKRY